MAQSFDLGRNFISEIKLTTDYLGYNYTENRYENFEEAVDDVIKTHETFYADYLTDLRPYIEEARLAYKQKLVLASQRNLQFRNEDIFKHNFRMYNCCTMYADKLSFLGNAFYLLLCGCGVGVNMMLPFVDRLPALVDRTKGVKTYVIEDSIEGWAKAAHVLFSSYAETSVKGYEEYQGYRIKFDYSNIRPKGAKVGRRFKAPGADGLKKSFERIERLLSSVVKDDEPVKFTSLDAYDCFMHLADAVLSGGVRRAACSIILSYEDTSLLQAKTGYWFAENPQRARSNNSVGLLRGKFTKEQFEHLLSLNDGMSDIGFVFMNNIFEILNPCFEISFTPVYIDETKASSAEVAFLKERIRNSDTTVLNDSRVTTGVQCCNLTEGNGALCKDEETFLKMCRALAILGTLQAGYTKFSHLEECLKESIEVSNNEALLGCSITGWANSPDVLFNPELLAKGAKEILKVNEHVAKIIGIKPTARATCVKPSGNASVILGCASGIHPEHSKNYFRVMQLNKDSETAKWLEKNIPQMLENGVYSSTNSDYALFVPISNDPKTTVLTKKELRGKNHLELIKLVQTHWVREGKVEERCFIKDTCHNVSNTVIIDDKQEITDYLFENQYDFTAVSFLSDNGDRDYAQAPFTEVLLENEIYEKYGKTPAIFFASGLIVDALAYFNNDLWKACSAITHPEVDITSTRELTELRKIWISRAKKFAKNYFKGNTKLMIECLKDVHLMHKWYTINRVITPVDFATILKEPVFLDIDSTSAVACAGGACEIPQKLG